jgi:hypothetical protein
MFPRLLSTLLIITSLSAQNYTWPIKASKSLSATFCEYRQGHLHAGVDIKTWGEMEVPCLAISDGYIQKVIVGYNGYGRGLFFRTKEGHLAVYGHLERFNPALEKMITEKQLELNRYGVSISFGPEDFPAKRGGRLGYSGTSGTEHPHLHFEIRDTLGTVLNPQTFYPGIKDTRAPVIDELLLEPATGESRVRQSRHALIVDPDAQSEPIQIQGSIRLAVNAHDRADGTYNKYNIYQAELFHDDSLVFEHNFHSLPLKLSDNVDLIYPGQRGKRGWRFMALYEDTEGPDLPFSPGHLHGEVRVSGLSALRVQVSDIKGNQKQAGLLVREQPASRWELIQEPDQILIVRHYTPGGYQRYQFFTGDKTYIPITQTLHTVSTTEWYLPRHIDQKGVLALAGLTGEIKWIIPPPAQETGSFEVTWSRSDRDYFFNVSSEYPYVFPLKFALIKQDTLVTGELVQIDDRSAESSLLPLSWRAEADSLQLVFPHGQKINIPLSPLRTLQGGAVCEISHDSLGIRLSGQNAGQELLYIQCDTLLESYQGIDVIGLRTLVLGDSKTFSGRYDFLHDSADTTFGIFKLKKKNQWKLIAKSDTTGLLSSEINNGDEFFVLQDSQAPQVASQNAGRTFKKGHRLLFTIEDNTGMIPHPRRSLEAKLDGKKFFPDYNPLRQELSFHIPPALEPGSHQFDLRARDEMGNETMYSFSFTLLR